MKTLSAFAIIILLCSCQNHSEQKEAKMEQISTLAKPEKITFPSLDSLPVTANLYAGDSASPVIVLCHQARYNKFEYARIAEKLNQKGFTCLAIDQRSGGPMVEENNETALKAIAAGKPVDYLDAEQDIIAAVNFASEKYNKKVILWGSSYSSTLALHIALENKNVAAVISFSPGDYFIDEKGSLRDKLKNLEKPMFVTSSKEEAAETGKMLENVKMSTTKVHFIPRSAGAHGSRALWETDENNKEYWTAINSFLEEIRKSDFKKDQ